MNCPNCQSDDTKTLKMASLTETTVSTTKGKTRNLLFSLPGGATINGGTTRSQSVTRLKLIDEITPPRPPASLGIALLVIVCASGFASAVLCRAIGLDTDSALWQIFTIVLASPLSVLAYFAHERMVREYNDAEIAFETTWICLRCGKTWLKE